jgi:phage repressor protein C with HTH and peptisase S24 domain
MTKYERLVESLNSTGKGQMKAFGNSMLPLIKSGSLLSYEKQDSYDVGDIVMCKVRGRWIDAHKVVAIGPDGQYLIANNRGHQNGWTRQVFGKVVAQE